MTKQFTVEHRLESNFAKSCKTRLKYSGECILGSFKMFHNSEGRKQTLALNFHSFTESPTRPM